MLFLTPFTVYGPPSTKLSISLQTHGCEVVDTLEPITPMVFIRMGISMSLSKAIAEELNLVFTKESKDGRNT